MKVAFILAAVVALFAAVTTAALTEEQTQFLFTRFAENFGKQYETSDVLNRYKIFQTNLNFILTENAKNQGFTLGINQFSDYTNEEYKAMLGFKPLEQQLGFDDEIIEAMGDIQLQGGEDNLQAVDFTKYAGAVKNQGNCGSCWAFSSTSTLETGYHLLTGSAIVLSEQHMVDCDTSDSGCNGGLPQTSLTWAKNGLCLDKDYPYTSGTSGKATSCKSSCTKKAKVTSISSVAASTTCANHKAALNKITSGSGVSTISIGIAAGNSYFQNYKSGILSTCSSKSQDHAVVALGVGSENGVDYIKIRNSWGTSWGESGYIRIAANGQVCGLCSGSNDRQPTIAKV
eukprot:UN00256